MESSNRERRNNRRGNATQVVRSPRVPSKRPADAQDVAWVAEEDQFVLQQAKKKAEIRIKNGRAKPIDWLTVMLRAIDPTRSIFDDEVLESELDYMDPEEVVENLDSEEVIELEKSIDTFLALEKCRIDIEFWKVRNLSWIIQVTKTI